MKIILVQPYYPKSFAIVPPLGLGYLASVLRKAGHNVQIVDCIAKNISSEKFKSLIKIERPEVIGITILSSFLEGAKKLIRETKEVASCHILIGGHHVTALPIESLKETGADFAVIGEGEETTVELLAAIGSDQEYDKIRGICYKSNEGKIVLNPQRPLIADIDDIPFPAWDLLDLPFYPPIPHGMFYKKHPSVNIITSRGCPMDCTFCAVKLTFGRRLRMRSAKNVVDEIELLIKTFGIKEFHFEDDNFTASRNHAMSICQEIISRRLDIVWSCPNGIRIDNLDEGLLKKMRESGCYKVSLGIEASSQNILDRAKKCLDIDSVPKTVRMIKKAQLEVEGFFIFGLPGETKETVYDTIKFALGLPLDIARFHNLAILPGTEIYNAIPREKTKDIDWSKTTTVAGEATLEIGDLHQKELMAFSKKAYRAFYLRPKNLIRILLMIKFKQLNWLIKTVIKLFV